MASVAAVLDYVRPQPVHVLRLLLADDHPIVRAGLRELLRLESDFAIVGETNNRRDTIELAARLVPDVVITDLSLGGFSGLRLITELHEAQPASNVLVLTVHKEMEYVKGALSAGALGYVLKDANRADLVNAIRNVGIGNYYLCAPVCDAVVSEYLESGGPPTALMFPDESILLGRGLTAREREVITLVAQGMSNKIIASHLSLSIKTVAKHRSNFMCKLNLHNIAGITMFAMSHALITPNRTAQQSRH